MAFNIPGLSWETARKIVKGTSIKSELQEDFFSDEFETELSNLKGVNRNSKLALLENWGRIKDNYQYMVISDSSEVQQSAAIPADLIKVCITGKLSSGTKSVFFKKYADKIIEADVKSCDYLIANEGRESSKYKQAIKLGKEIVTESEFLEKIK